jgi:hypothetical protein
MQKKVDPSLQVEVKPSIRARKIQEEKVRRQAQKEEFWRRREQEQRWREEMRYALLPQMFVAEHGCYRLVILNFSAKFSMMRFVCNLDMVVVLLN